MSPVGDFNRPSEYPSFGGFLLAARRAVRELIRHFPISEQTWKKGRETGRVAGVAARCAGARLWRPVERRCYRFAENGLVAYPPARQVAHRQIGSKQSDLSRDGASSRECPGGGEA